MKKIAMFIVLLLVGCAIVPIPTQEQADNADYGSSPSDYQEIVKTFMSGKLLDPYSAVYTNWKGPHKGWISDPHRGNFYGYRVCVDVNAKNRIGGYNVGSRPYYFMINNERVVYHTRGTAVGTRGYYETIEICGF